MARKRLEITKSKKIMKDIRQVLYRDWDPIGIFGYGPEDEYDACIGPVYQILSTSRSEKELVDVLRSFEMKSTALADDVLESVARNLLAISTR